MPNKKSDHCVKTTLAAGEIDSTFGIDGQVKLKDPINFGRFLSFGAVVVDPNSEVDQRIYVTAHNPGSGQYYVARFLANGELDVSYGDAGYASLPTGDLAPSFYTAFDNLVVDERGGVVCFGCGEVHVEGVRHLYPIAASLTPAGKPDETFGNSGFAMYELPHSSFYSGLPSKVFNRLDMSPLPKFSLDELDVMDVSAPALMCSIKQKGGQITFLFNLYFYMTVPNPAISYLGRINADGTLDLSFGEGGLKLIQVKLSSDSGLLLLNDAYCDVDSQGRIVVGGKVGTVGVVICFTTQGDIDPAFGELGVVRFEESGSEDNTARSVKVLEDQKIVVQLAFAGGPFGFQTAGIIRLLSDGVIDPDFNGGLPSFVEAGKVNYVAVYMEVDDEGRVVISGMRVVVSGEEFFQRPCLSRFMVDGSLDQNFGGEGSGTVVLGEFIYNHTMALQSGADVLLQLSVATEDGDVACLVRVLG